MSTQQLHQILEAGSANPPPEQGGPQAIRAWFETMMEPTPVPDMVSIEPVQIGGNEGELLRAPDADPAKLVIYFHGGGWLFGSPRSHRVIAANLARASGATVLSAQYRRAPEHPAPAPQQDADATYAWALAQGYEARKIAIAGDSAGGNMALAAAVNARDAGLPLPAALVLLSPALDLAGDGKSHTELADAPLVDARMMGLFNMFYLGGTDPRSPEATPFYAEMTGLPPSLIHVGSWEILRDDSVTLSEKLRAAGVETEFRLWEGMCHNHQLFAPFIEEGMASLDEAGAFLRRRLG